MASEIFKSVKLLLENITDTTTDIELVELCKKYNIPDDIINIIKQDRKSYTNKLKFMLNLTNISVGETNSLNILKNIVEN